MEKPKRLLRDEIARLSTSYFGVNFTRHTSFSNRVRSLAQEMFLKGECSSRDARIVRQALKMHLEGVDITEETEVEEVEEVEEKEKVSV